MEAEILYRTLNLSGFSNVISKEELRIFENKLKYTFYEFTDGQQMVVEYYWPFSTILHLLKILLKVHQADEKPFNVSVTIDLNCTVPTFARTAEMTYFTILFNRTESYKVTLIKNSASYKFSSFSPDQVYRFFNRFLAFFKSENAKSNIPYLTIDRTDFDAKFKAIFL